MCSDLSVFHGIRDANELDAVTFWKLAWRLPAYQGAVGAIAAAQHQDSGGGRALEPGSAGDVRARFRAAQSMPVASAAELMAASAPMSGLSALGTVAVAGG